MNNHLDRLFANDAYEVFDDSDQERAESSDDDVDIILHGTMQQIRKMQHRNIGREYSSEEDEFEKEMTSELNQTMKTIEENRSTASMPEAGKEEAPSFYDNCYFDSDSDEEGTSEEKRSKKRPVLSNDELFYDPEMDDKDQKWIDNKRLSYQPKGASSSSATGSTPGKPRPLPTSDAVLNCPGCMTLLCLDCQRHATYMHQYRAMFVTNCAPDMTEVLRHSLAKLSKQKKSRKRRHGERGRGEDVPEEFAETEAEPADSGATVDELYHPVRCDLCRTEVAVYDKDEVYHFYNVLASY